jgi:hypothetical protein
MRTISELKQHCKAVGNTFFSKGNARYFNSSKVFGIYRAPYTPDTEGYVIAETIFYSSDGAPGVYSYVVYRFEAAPDYVDWSSPIGKHPSLSDAVAFLKSMGAVKQ